MISSIPFNSEAPLINYIFLILEVSRVRITISVFQMKKTEENRDGQGRLPKKKAMWWN